MNYDKIYLPKHIKSALEEDSRKMTIVTRFPPEPSGYMHLGHMFAIKLNQSVAKYYKGKFMVRFDDTNPKSESAEYERAILDDLNEMNLTIDNLSYVSDFFDFLIEKATELIKLDVAYVDCSTSEEMAHQRKTLEGSKFRDNSIEENLHQWNQMKDGISNGCLRLKAFPGHKNSAMRDPVLYRVLNMSHHRTGNKYKVYPMYDFACPILDSYAGVTHIFRSKEYVERDDQMKFILGKLLMRIPRVFTYGRLEVDGAVLSKRKIKEGICNGVYSGWDDKTLFTFRGMKNRGICLEGIDKFLCDVGFPENMITIEKQKILTINTKVIDKYATRIISLPKDNIKIIKCFISDEDNNIKLTKNIPLFNKNPILGNRDVILTSEIFISDEDYSQLSNGEEVTLLYFGNVIYHSENNSFVSHFSGKPGDTSKKLLWLPVSQTFNMIINDNNGNLTNVVCENHVKSMKDGDYIQLYKMGYYYKHNDTLVEL